MHCEIGAAGGLPGDVSLAPMDQCADRVVATAFGEGYSPTFVVRPVMILQSTFLDWTLCFSQLRARMTWIFIPAYCFAIP